MGKLQAVKIKTLPPGSHSDGNCLYLRVKNSGARSWVFRYKVNGKPVELGMGSVSVRTLSEARDLAVDMKRAIAAGSNPKNLLTPKQQTKTFADYALELIESKRAGWRNAKHAQQWVNTLQEYVFPFIGKKPVQEIHLEDIKRILKPIWYDKTETASRVRMRVEAVLDFGYLHESIDKANPARWRGCLDHIYPSPKKTQPVEHFEAIYYDRLPEIMTILRAKTSMSAYCVRWIALTACRSNEAREMMWDEIDIDNAIWTIPGKRIKAGREHRVPLSQECIEILEKVKTFNPLSKKGLVYFNQYGDALSDVAISKALKSISYKEATIHGLRSSFRDWAAEKTQYPREVCEQALAHAIGAVEGAYRRSDLFNKRRILMNDWADYLNK
ncbi:MULTISPECIES: tyrosine-type recombinase/integrase [Nitrosomonas]|uniref:Integrase n=1 Tax=Nitrosomonas communis TaxID=44574 RepID=A0A0F7KH54_9PROT|nr:MULTISPECIES: site-specific integrase [Nitrosomonas]AKH38172.1 integrase [Nitrosomonas communis]TYP91154.1 integrase [Nitrosomonas communis]UVS60131.1 tyrosine-type recombinase/integrase [Nitrosomonas sp. PLL12]